MQKELRRVVLWCVLILATLATREAGAVALTPGSYTVSMKYVRNGKIYVRLAMYSFRSNNTFRADYWEWDNGPLVDYTRGVQRIGFAFGELGAIMPTDADAFVYGSRHFLGATGNGNENLTVRYGTWSLYKNTNIKITWSDDGRVEWWKRTWHDETLNKIEVFYIGYADGNPRDTNLLLYTHNASNHFLRNNNALNIGFGFGGDTVGFTFGHQALSAFNTKRMTGQSLTWNRYCIDFPYDCIDPPLTEDTYDDHSVDFNDMTTTTTGILRQWIPAADNDGVHEVFSYVAIPAGNTSMTSRRVVFQIGTDYGQGTIGNGGHLTSALQIIDSNRNLRGFVMTETTFERTQERNAMYIMGSSFLLDNATAAAQTGIEDPYNY